jgi:ABC-2 type transport system ATP-binding protein
VNTQPIIQLQGLSKTFGTGRKTVQAVRDLNLEIRPGQVYGFLGRNGAGKTTTIRLLLGLVRPSRGSARIDGRETRDNPRVLRRVGSLVEDPCFYPFLSGRDNLLALARTAGSRPGEEIDGLLNQVGLSGRAASLAAGYSKGMRQRLGIAAALLGDPDLIILDEPTNGLDPGGILEIRQFIRRLVDQRGKTVFLSSHLLSEVEQICDRVAIIHQGQITREGRVAELLASSASSIHIQAIPAAGVLEALQPEWQGRPLPGENPSQPSWIEIQAAPDQAPEIVRRLAAAGIDLHQVRVQQLSLEEFFLQTTGEGSDD